MNEKANNLFSVIRRYDVRASASPRALFMPKHSEKPGPVRYWIAHDIAEPKKEIRAIDRWFGFYIYGTPNNHPADPIYETYKTRQGWWGRIQTDPVSLLSYFPLVQLTRPAVLIVSVGWNELHESASMDTLYIRTSTEKLDRRLPNQPADVEWAIEKVKWLWKRALPAEPLPRIEIYTTYRDDHRAEFEAQEREYADSAEAGADVMAYGLYGPGGKGMAKKAEEAFQALQACGPGWHTFNQVIKKLEGKASSYHKTGLERCWRFGKIEQGIWEDEMPADRQVLTEIYRVLERSANSDKKG